MKITGLAFILFCPFLLFPSMGSEENPGGYQYVFPHPGSKYIHPHSTIILRFETISPEDLLNFSSFIKVSGDKSGPHDGKTVIASDNRTLIFKPEQGYEYGEKVEVTIDPRLSGLRTGMITPLHFEFTVLEQEVNAFPPDMEREIPSGQKKSTTNSGPMIMSNGVSVPSDFPHVNITQNNDPSSDYIFLNNWGPPNYNIIVNTSGAPVWYWKTPDRRRDFKVQSNGWITMLVRDGYGGSGEGFIALTENFEYIKSMRATNGYVTDEHELFMLPDSGYFLIGRRETTVDMSQFVTGGKTNATVRETCIQEFTANDELIFIWRAWDHFDISDMELESLTEAYIRFPHMNAIFTDEDGHILLSSRHLSEISKIHRQSGEFIWRLSGIPGSPNNDFKFVDDPLNGFRNQHAVRSLGNNFYALFDNGNMHDPPVSRGVEYEIDTVQMTATLVWEQGNDLNDHWSHYMGNTQRLPNGNTHINWAVGNVLPIAAEYTPEGDKVFEMQFEKGYHCYRSFRHPWDGKSQIPYLLLEPQVDNIALIFNKFGDNQVDYYNIYGGTTPNPANIIDTSHSTIKHLTGLENGNRYYFRVTAVDKSGSETGFSNEENIMVNIIHPGSNLIVNGDFSNSLDAWTWEVGNSASADVQVDEGVCHFMIENGGDQIYEVQLRQNSLPLILGQDYIFEFDAWADGPRIVEIKVGEDDSPFTNYSRIGYSALTSTSKPYTFSFKMQESSDMNSRVVINAGTDAQDIYIDNLSLRMDSPANIDDHSRAIGQVELQSNYPNPFNRSTTLSYTIPDRIPVSLKVFDGLGREVAELVNEVQSPGNYEVIFDASNLDSGVYYYRMAAGSFVQTRKMLLLR